MSNKIKLSTLRAINFATVSVGKGGTNSAMQSVHINDEDIVCTNGHHLTMFKHDDEFFKAVHDCPFSLILLRDDLRNLKEFIKLTKKLDDEELIEFILNLDEGTLSFNHKDISLCLVLTISPFEYPRYQEIIPKNKADISIGFNRKYLVELLENMKCDNVRFDIYGDLLPVKITSTNAEDDNKLSLISPVRL